MRGEILMSVPHSLCPLKPHIKGRNISKNHTKDIKDSKNFNNINESQYIKKCQGKHIYPGYRDYKIYKNNCNNEFK